MALSTDIYKFYTGNVYTQYYAVFETVRDLLGEHACRERIDENVLEHFNKNREKFSFDWYSYGKISALASLYNLVICLVNSKKELIYFGDKKVDARFIYMINDDSKNSFQGLMAVKRDDPKEIIKEFTGYNMAKDLLDDFIRNDLQYTDSVKDLYSNIFAQDTLVPPVECPTIFENLSNAIDNSAAINTARHSLDDHFRMSEHVSVDNEVRTPPREHPSQDQQPPEGIDEDMDCS